MKFSNTEIILQGFTKQWDLNSNKIEVIKAKLKFRNIVSYMYFEISQTNNLCITDKNFKLELTEQNKRDIIDFEKRFEQGIPAPIFNMVYNNKI